LDPIEEIRALRAKWGREVVLLSHHYQRMEIADLADHKGDSYELSRVASEAKDARFIVFCGVRFMAEAAEVLRREEQRVVHPVAEAGCPMADMAPAEDAAEAWERIAALRGPEAVMPIVYMNSGADLKALVGKNGGCVCTSSNAPRAFRWAFERREAVFFFPDEHLGRNTAHDMGIAPAEMVMWDPRKPDGGLTGDQIRSARVILWKGWCHVHVAFTPEDVRAARERFPQGQIHVHPECPREVVELADGAGSTSYLVQTVEQAAPGTTLVIGTEINLVERLARDFPDRTVVPLKRSLCHNMYRIDLHALRDALRRLPEGPFVELPPDVKKDAATALERMLSI